MVVAWHMIGVKYMKLYNVLMHKKTPNDHVLFIKLGNLNYRLNVDTNEYGNYITCLNDITLTGDVTMSHWTNVPKGFIWKPF